MATASDDNAAYDNLNRVIAFRAGTLTASGNNGSTPDTITTANLNSVSGVESTDTWTYDALGNWTSSDPDGTSESNTFNSQNQETAQGSNTLSYDSNGNMLTDEQGYHYVYDAWNRLVTVKNQADTSTKETFVYDALGRAIISNNGSGNDHAYYSSQGQVIQQQYTTDYSQNVWGLGYVNNLVLRDRNADNSMSTGNLGIGGSGLEEREYSLADADWSVIALANTSGAATERFAYDPYGKLAILTSSWAAGSDGSNYWLYFFQGMKVLDDGTDYSMFRSLTRIYDIDLGRWGQEDPTGPDYVNGMNLYQMEEGNTPISADPFGTESVIVNTPDGGYDLINAWAPSLRYHVNPPPQSPSPATSSGTGTCCCKRQPLSRNDFFYPSSKLDKLLGDLLFKAFSSSPVSGFYAMAGPAGQAGPVGGQAGAGFTWDIDNGYYVGVEAYGGYGGSNFLWGGGWSGYSQDGGWDSPTQPGNYGGFGGIGPVEAGFSGDRGTSYLGFSSGLLSFGVVMNNQKLLDWLDGQCSCSNPYSKPPSPPKATPQGPTQRPPTQWHWLYPNSYPELAQ